MIDGDHMISYNFADVGIAVSTERTNGASIEKCRRNEFIGN